ncbi:MAG TPA: DUF3810 domain-containing protein [Chitinophaga sp.]|uniref:DUF3810 domain-containing protein n=1 Tax=Chitinophaga sp. TaxID=1869181 RepID=UPI002DBC03DA|nr:DUF3810 domain-containing protein [Chitinophaga sp.]HEU4555113.1 DUF3810 domain-containing protein [Chitinophaga sp.]
MEIKAAIKRSVLRIVITVICLLLLNLLFSISESFASFYFHRLYVWISTLLRRFIGSVNLSVGDLIYTAWVIGAVIFLLKLCYNLVRGRWQRLALLLINGLGFIIGVYLAFLLLWGYNYRRHSLAADMGLHMQVKPYNVNQLYRLADTLLQQVNQQKAALGDTMGVAAPDPDSASLFRRATLAYEQAAARWPSLRYKYPSVKRPIYSYWLNYIGVTGYLNPFTNEAQVNVTTPQFTRPFTTCHEIAHQLGYAPEETANFVGYLVAGHSSDIRFRYAASLEMFLYSTGQLARQDTALAHQVWNRAVPGIKADYQYIIDFYRSFRGPLDDYSQLLYDQYLKANKQEKGIHSYSEVVGWLIAYYGL